MKKLMMLAVALLALTGCDSDKDKAIKAAEAKITAMTDNITGITFSDMEYFHLGEDVACVRGKFRTDHLKETRFVILTKDNEVIDDEDSIRLMAAPGAIDNFWGCK